MSYPLRIFVICLLSFIGQGARGQTTFSQRLLSAQGGGVGLEGVQLAPDGQFWVSGIHTDRSYDFWIGAVDSLGVLKWETSVGGYDYEINTSLLATRDGGMVAIGHTWTYADRYNDAWLVKLNKQGQVQWQSNFGEPLGTDVAMDVVETADGGYVTVSESVNPDTVDATQTGLDILIAHHDSSGQLIWERKIASKNRERGRAIVPAIDGGYIIGGATSFDMPDGLDTSRYFIWHISEEGNRLWTSSFPNPNMLPQELKLVNDIIISQDSQYLIAGRGAVMKLDQAGDLLWMNAAQGGEAMAGLPEGGFVVVARSRLTRYDASGNILWEKFYDTSERYRDVEVLPDGGFILAGTHLTRTDCEGNVLNPVQCLATTLPRPLEKLTVSLTQTADGLIVEVPAPSQPLHLHLYDVTGRRILQQPLKRGKQVIHLPEMSPTVLFYRIIGAQPLQTGKILYRP